MDNRIVRKWDISLTEKLKERRKYKFIKTEDFERYQRLICHYDEELKKYKDFLNELRKSTMDSHTAIACYIRTEIDKFNTSNKRYQEEGEECLNTNVLDVVRAGIKELV